MTGSLISRFAIDQGSIVAGPVQASPFIPGSSNVFPKFKETISEAAWELWYFDGVSEVNKAAVVIGVTRNAEGRKQGGFKVQVFAIWPDETTWHRDLFFPESVVSVTAEGDTLGIWRDPSAGCSISFSFSVQANSSRAELIFDVPGVVEGTMGLISLPGDTGIDTRAELGPSVWYVRPIGRAAMTADMTFSSSESKSSRHLSLGPQDGLASGGMDRVWSALSWPQIMTESYYLRARVGPYSMQLMRILSSVETGKQPYSVARLYREGKLICAAQKVLGPGRQNELLDEDSVVVEKVNANRSTDGLTGAYRDQNTGYLVEFVRAADGDRWRFHVRHDRILWNMSTSAPGPNGTGNTGFIESVVGGCNGESFQGVGTGGQCELTQQ